jgi:hypothetical protein
MRRVLLIAGAATVAVLAAAALGVFLWLRDYAPLAAAYPITPGPGLQADVEPAFGSGGKPVLMPAFHEGDTFKVTVTIRNTGRFAVTLDEPSGLRLAPHDSGLVPLSWKLHCPARTPQLTWHTVQLRYHYLSSFTRTETVELPFAVTVRCPSS